MDMEEGALNTATGESLPTQHYTADRSPVPMVYSDGRTSVVRYVNPAFCQLAGKAAEELIGRPFAIAVPEGKENGCLALLSRVYETSATETLADQEHAPSSGPSVYWSYVAWAIHDAQERPIGIMMQVTDTSVAVHEREKAALISEALLLYGLEYHELVDALHEREEAVSRNEEHQRSLVKQHEEITLLNTRLQRAMQETHHRVKNNLQIVSALAEIQMDGESATVPASALERIATHVRTLAALHDILTQQAKDIAGTTLSTSVTFGRLLPLLQVNIGTRRIHSRIENIFLTIGNSSSLSLLVSELVSNAVKHGKGDITVTLSRHQDEAELTVADEGAGFPEAFDPRKAANTGLDLALSLARHDLRGEITFANRPEGGGRVVVRFPLYNEP